MKKLTLFLLAFPGLALAEVELGGFIDTYYAYDLNEPSSQDRSFTTQPSRSEEFNVNLAYAEAVLKEDRRRGRLALQFGTSVDANYAAEPVNNIQILQEAYGGVKLSDKLWVDAGIFFSHIGFESFISKNNITYTRSFNADNVPYYASGVRFEYAATKSESYQFQILNGWQNIQENNTGKALAFQYKRLIDPTLTFTYNNFLGDEKLTTSDSRFRTYHNFMIEKTSGNYTLQYSLDFGTQAQEENDGVDPWFVTAAVLGQKLSETERLGYRLEYYLDPHEANIITETSHGFEVLSASVNFDKTLAEDTLWRTELRGYYSKDEIYPAGRNSLNYWDGVLVSSLALSF